ncbi:protocadherin alpha-5-like isoform X2 [Spea bombifrons]|uniref:protocadherin alpha-5-like isoform X2 n=1 Tax=Spea bombifrons TaxID=233779 RepID=UPI0023493BDE|nr:protocadherin alpha-5-like isoform X2 [Spea bombifrons]
MLGLMKDLQVKIQFIILFLLQMSQDLILGQLHYMIPEESKHGTFVGRLVQDLGLEIGEINSRMLRIVSRDEKEYFQVNLQNGILFVKDMVDREVLCPTIPVCVVSLQVIVDKPVQIYHVDVEIEDINDNCPVFSAKEYSMSIAESRLPGARFPLEGAFDSDVGTNSITSYELSTNDYFTLEFPKYIHQIRSVELVLKKSLDREKISVHNLTLVAFDGGKPRFNDTTQLVINVDDANDNAPTFNQSFYQCRVTEHVAKGTLVIKLNATDMDQGKNGKISYVFSKLVPLHVVSIFNLGQTSGEIRVNGELDYEDNNVYEIHVDAVDHGEPQLTGHCKIVVSVVDINDNPPEMTLTSLSVPVPEDAPQGTIVAIISVHDKDSGKNGKVNCRILQPSPFKINPALKGDFSVIVNTELDRETQSEYEIVITAEDEGFPPLSSSQTIKVVLSDVNDNVPLFLEPVSTIFIKENNPPGFHVYTASASDSDINQNSFITYSIIESTIGGIPLSSYISINADNGNVFALVSFDHEQVTYFQCHIKATDAGFSPLSSNLTLNIFILDVNDNPPAFVSHFSSDISAVKITTSTTAQPGQLVSKVKAVDLDSGYNAWISYKFKDLPVDTPFGISAHTGEITLMRAYTESDSNVYKMAVVAQDHGEPPMTAVTQLLITFVNSGEGVKIENYYHLRKNENEFSEENIYLIISICAISSIFLVTLISFTVLRWQKYKDEVNELRENYRIYSDTVGSWVYSQQSQCKFYLNSTQAKNDLIVFTPNGVQSSVSEDNNSTGHGIIQNLLYQPKHPHPDWRYSASLRAAMQGAVHVEGAAILRGGPVGLEQQWPTVSSATPEPEGGEVSPPVGAGVNCNSWTFKYGPGNQKQPVPQIPPDFPENFIIPGSPAIISIRQDQPSNQGQKSNFITFGKKEETKKKKKKKKGSKNQEKGNNAVDNNDQ